ncbi:OmpA family protein [Rheinheimera riviphila]|uniref:OmpA family protein n=1 Tax=Rheinheimera riviphila TaxID=1834037 RepID=A0A437QIN8_9GAMM|nr:OmpA family protein [Rheinheimera riviphila]RVU34391.1 OmpA family protein [Rheinheimera riviphila]
MLFTAARRVITSVVICATTVISLNPLLATSAHANEQAHPLFSAYPGADADYYRHIDYDQFQLPTSAVVADNTFSSISAQGAVTRHLYEIKQVSTTQVYQNYLQAVKAAGFSLVFSCELAACGFEDGQAIGSLLSIRDNVYNYFRKPYYLLTKKGAATGPVYAAWYIGSYEENVWAHQVIIEGKKLVTDLIKVDTTALTVKEQPVAAISADELAKDHPLLSRYPGADLEGFEKIDTEIAKVPVPGKAALNLQGDLARHTYEIDQVSSLKVFENYQHALQKAGFSALALCKLAECGDTQTVEALGGPLSVQNSVYNFHRNPYYLLSKLSVGGQEHYVALLIGAYDGKVRVQQLILSTKTVQTDLVKADASELKRQLDSAGKALIYGIYFDTGKAEIKPESDAALAEIAKLLQQHHSLKLYVVGHTDDTGDSAANQTLSEQRASAVVAKLTGSYQIAASRLQAHGVGPFAPASNNTSAAGKQLNRRVELVQKL